MVTNLQIESNESLKTGTNYKIYILQSFYFNKKA